MVLGHRSIPTYQEALCKPWISCQSTKDQAALQSFAETQLSGRRGAGLHVPSPRAPPIELGLPAGRLPAEGMLPFSLMSDVKGKEERKRRMKSQNSHNKNVIKLFSFLYCVLCSFIQKSSKSSECSFFTACSVCTCVFLCFYSSTRSTSIPFWLFLVGCECQEF